MSRSALTDALRALALPVEDYVVFGSGPMFAHGLRTELRDLDVIARRAAWAKACRDGEPESAPSGCGSVVRLHHGRIEIFNAWTSPAWDVAALIDSAQVIDGIPYVPLPIVLRWKLSSDRPKDRADVIAICAYLSSAESFQW
jgi:hypothetical protein